MKSESNTHKDNFEKLKWQFALENSNIGIWDYNADLDRVFFSEESKNIIGFNDNEFGTNPNDWNDRVHADDRKKYFQDFQDHLKGLKPLYKNEHRVLCKDGTYKWVSDIGKIIKWNEDGTPNRIIGTHTDITERKEKEVSQSNAINLITKQNNKLKSFAHIVTHNLKQHASNFESLLDFYDEANTNKEKQEFIGLLKTLSNSLTKTITNLNDVVLVQASKNKEIKKIFVAEEINSIFEMLNIVVTENKATIINEVDPKLYIYYNISYFESVIQNLLTNAIKYKHPDRNPVIHIKSEFKEDVIEISIRDNGIGIDLEKYGNEIFNLYKTFHHNEDAEGVGLYLIKNQIEAFGGEITVSSEVNKGTTFTILAKRK